GDTTSASNGSSGNISLNAPHMNIGGSLEAFAINQGGTSFQNGAISRAGLGATVVGGTSATLPNLDTGGANLSIAATSISLPSGSYINSRQTSWGAANDTTSNSTGNSGSITLTAPTISLGGQLNAYSTGGTAYKSGTISLAGLGVVTIGPTGTLPNFATNGASLSIAAASISLPSGGIIDTRQLNSGGHSTGDSGDITFSTPNISLGGTLLAYATSGTTYKSGTIYLTGLGTVSIGPGGTLPNFDTNGASLSISAGNITLAATGYINTRQVNSSVADDIASPSAGNSGNIALNAASFSLGAQPALNAFAGGNSFQSGTITLGGMNNFEIGSGGNVTSLETKGANLVISTTGGASSITLDPGGTIDTTQSGGPPGNVTLSADTVTLKSQIAAYSASSSYPSGTITLKVDSFDVDGINQPDISTNGANLVIDATNSITIGSGGAIDTRQLDSSNHSTGNSGSLSLDSPSLTLDGTLNLIAVNTSSTDFSSGGLNFSGPSDFTIGGSGGNLPSLDTDGISVSI